jgi:hypothetical protein
VAAALGAGLVLDVAGRRAGLDSQTWVIRRTSTSTSSSVINPRSGRPSEPAETPPPDR